MTAKSSEKTRARALQQDTGWSYSECLRLVRTKTEDQLDELIRERAAKRGART